MARILFVSSEGRLGGAEISLLLHIKSLDGCFALSVACPMPSPLAQALAAHRIETHPLPPPPSSGYRSWHGVTWWWAAARCLVTATRQIRADLIHANSFYAGAAALPAALATRRKLVVHARDLADFGVLRRWYGRYADRLIAVSGAVKKELVCRGVRPDKIDVVPNGLDLNAIRFPGTGSETPAPQPAPRGDLVFAHVGQFAPWKNHDLFIRAAAQVRARYGLPERYVLYVGNVEPRKNVPALLEVRQRLHRDGLPHELVIVGRRTWRAGSTQRSIQREVASGGVVRIGYANRGDLPLIHQMADVFLFPSLFEGFGLPPLEAMACGTPVVCSSRGALAETVVGAAWIVDPANVPEVAAAVRTLLTDTHIRDRYVENGRRRSRGFTWTAAAEATLAVYQESASAHG